MSTEADGAEVEGVGVSVRAGVLVGAKTSVAFVTSRTGFFFVCASGGAFTLAAAPAAIGRARVGMGGGAFGSGAVSTGGAGGLGVAALGEAVFPAPTVSVGCRPSPKERMTRPASAESDKTPIASGHAKLPVRAEDAA
jgi:hypothetical protein